jgi:hypothetical protein
MSKSAKQIVDEASRDSDKLPDVLHNLPIVTEPRCNVCKSEFRPLIDRMIAGPYSYSAIARQFRGKDRHLAGNVEAVRKSIERHAKSHVTIRDQAIREIVESRAMEAGLMVDDMKNSFLTAEALLELYMQKGFEQVTKEDTWVRHQDILEAAKQFREMKKDTVFEEVESMKKQVWALSQAVRETVPEYLQPKILERAYELLRTRDIDIPAPPPPKPIQLGEVVDGELV